MERVIKLEFWIQASWSHDSVQPVEVYNTLRLKMSVQAKAAQLESQLHCDSASSQPIVWNFLAMPSVPFSLPQNPRPTRLQDADVRCIESSIFESFTAADNTNKPTAKSTISTSFFSTTMKPIPRKSQPQQGPFLLLNLKWLEPNWLRNCI